MECFNYNFTPPILCPIVFWVDVRPEEETAEGERKGLEVGEEGGGEGAFWRSQSRQTGVRACVRG